MGGGGTDLPSYYTRRGGFLMAAAINRYVFIMVNRRFQKSFRLSYSRTEIVSQADEIEHNIFREALKFAGVDTHLELVSVADVPAQCGLGTSSSFTVSLLNGLFSFQRRYVNLSELAEAACRVEIGILQEPIGKQDQYVASFGGFNAYTFHLDGTVSIEPVRISEENVMTLQNNILLFHLGKERSASETLEEQNRKSLDGDANVLSRLDTIKDIGLQTRKAFEAGRIDEFGELLHSHWMSKRLLSSKVTDPVIDEAYELARINGALGGKVVGAGGGGFLLVYCPKNRSKVIVAMGRVGLRPTWFSFEHEGAKIVYHG